jgi:cytochrome c oxidase cbb3-type subunit 3
MSDTHPKEVDQVSGVETTGHEWDGLKELNNPLPKWWLYLFYVTIVWAVIYWVRLPIMAADFQLHHRCSGIQPAG